MASAVEAMGVLRALDAARVSVPRDMSVIVIHDPWFAELLHPLLTTSRCRSTSSVAQASRC